MRSNYLLAKLTYLILMISFASHAQENSFESVSDEMLLNPDPSDWLMYSRTYDNQRFSPLDQINRENVNYLEIAWARLAVKDADEAARSAAGEALKELRRASRP